jgi:hypothetical protein
MDREGNTISKPSKIREPWRAVFPISKWPGKVRGDEGEDDSSFSGFIETQMDHGLRQT